MSNEKNRGEKNEWFITIIILAVITFLTYLFHKITPKKSKTDKADLIEMYGIDKKTLAKWVLYFCDPTLLNHKTYLSKRRLTDNEVNHIIESFGIPCKELPVRTKGDIIKISEGTYRSLSQNISKYPEKYSISKEAFAALSKFPPRIVYSILQHYN